MKQSSAAAERNRDPIVEVLNDVLPRRGLALEIASGSGQHVVHFAAHFPKLLWQPSDAEPVALRSIEAWRAESGLFNLLPPVSLDVRSAEWPVSQADALLCINMIHISPWAAAQALFRGAKRTLAAGAPLFLYGPYFREGVEAAPSNLAFDQDLRSRNPEWGLRDLEAVTSEAESCGFILDQVVSMPANNLSITYRKT